MSEINECCENCRFFYKGHCRFYAPQVAQVGELGQLKRVRHLPIVNHDDFCGEFSRKPRQTDIKSIPQENRLAIESLLNLPHTTPSEPL